MFFLTKICKFISVFLILFCCFVCFSSAYQQEGFLEYKELGNKISFDCENHCTINLGKKGGADALVLDGKIEGMGSFIIYSKGPQRDSFIDKVVVSYTGNRSIDLSNYEKLLYYIPEDRDLLISFNGINGNLKGNIMVDKVSLSMYQKILRWRDDFWIMETFGYGGMNFRNGVFIWGRSIVEYGYIVFAFVALCILVISLILKKGKERVFKLIFYFGLSLFFLVGFRNIVTGTVLLRQGLSGFKSDYSLFELKDYIGFVVKVRDRLHLDDFEKGNCKIFIKNDKASYNWAVDFHGEYFFVPCERVYSGYLADYIMYAGVEIDEEAYGRDILLEHNGKYLLDNRGK